MHKLLIIDDDVTFCTMLKTLLTKHGYDVVLRYSGNGLTKLITNTFFDVILSDIRLPDVDGMDLLKCFNKITPKSQVIMLTGYANYNTAVRSIKEGAYSYVPKPFSPDEVLTLVKEAIAESKIRTNHQTQKNKINISDDYIIGNSNVSKLLNKHITLVAPTKMSILILGKSGTGKEYIAKSIHQQSSKKDSPFIPVDCGTIPKELVASELFGHKKGSFTGATEDKKGYFELANKGTLFLDEVGNLPYDTQVQLLRVLQERQIRPIGSDKWINIDVRIIAATNNNLKESIQEGTFREDLYHRLNEFSFEAPPLSERKEDIIQFANHFLNKSNSYLNKNIKGFTDEASHSIKKYIWPGNLRELKNVINRAVLLSTSEKIGIEHLPNDLINNDIDTTPIHSNEKELIIKILKTTNNNKSKTARLLKIDRKTLYNKLKLYNIEY